MRTVLLTFFSLCLLLLVEGAPVQQIEGQIQQPLSGTSLYITNQRRVLERLDFAKQMVMREFQTNPKYVLV